MAESVVKREDIVFSFSYYTKFSILKLVAFHLFNMVIPTWIQELERRENEVVVSLSVNQILVHEAIMVSDWTTGAIALKVWCGVRFHSAPCLIGWCTEFGTGIPCLLFEYSTL